MREQDTYAYFLARGQHMDDAEYARWLEQYARRFLRRMERLFGPRDPSYLFRRVFRNPEYVVDAATDFPDEAPGIIDIHVNRYPPRFAVQMVAHECVHLLDNTWAQHCPVLEEGLATWVQSHAPLYPPAMRGHVRNWCPDKDYADALRLVRRARPMKLVRAVKALRESGVRMEDIRWDQLAERGIDAGVARCLVGKFYDL